MSYFIPSFLQKRILRYALSRLEVLDTDALGLDNLEITWGKKSTVELKDVGIHTQKITTLLGLPKAFFVTQAKIQRLRLTIPADLHQSGIWVEIDGVSLQIDWMCPETEAKKCARDQNGKRAPKAHTAERGRRSRSRSHVPSDLKETGVDGFPNRLPSTKDLAQSFLQTESENEKELLESALLKSQLKERPEVSAQTDDEGSDIGIGHELLLPAFLASFLQGVAERVRVSVQNVRVDFVLHLELPTSGSGENSLLSTSETLTIRVQANNIEIEAIQSSTAADVQDAQDIPVARAIRKSRRISLDDAQVMVISESPLLSRVAQSLFPSSPDTDGSSAFIPARSSSPLSNRARYKKSRSNSPLSEHVGRSSLFGLYNTSHDLEAIDDDIDARAYPEPLSATVASDVGRLKDQLNEAMPHEQMYWTGRPRHKTDLTNGAQSHSAANPGSKQCLQTDITQDQVLASGQDWDKFLSASNPKEPPPHIDARYASTNTARNTETPATSHPYSEASSCPDFEDLTESRLYTHDEALSMYMSAMDQISADDHDRSTAMPGAWNSTLSSNDVPQRIERLSRLTSRHFRSTASSPKPSQTYLLETKNHKQTPPQPIERHHGHGEHLLSTHSPVGQVCARKPEPVAENPSSQIAHDSPVSLETKAPPVIAKKLFSVQGAQFTIFEAVADVQPIQQSKFLAPVTRKPRLEDASSSEPHPQQPAAVHLDIKSTEILGDMTLTKTILLLLQQTGYPYKDKALEDHQIHRDPGFELRAEFQEVSWRLFDSIQSQELTESLLLPKHSHPEIPAMESELLLRADLKGLRITHLDHNSSATTKLGIDKCRFGYATDDIISFDATLRMRGSVRDTLSPLDEDVSVTTKTSKLANTLAFDMTTRPLYVVLDLRRLDETLSWFGGLSSVLELGTSVVSTVTIRESHHSTNFPEGKRGERNVRFSFAERSPLTTDTSNIASNKLNVRLGGLHVKLQGHHSSLQLKSSAIKIVRRFEGIGLQIDRLKVIGPCPEPATTGFSSLIKLSNVRIEYLTIPKEIDLTRLVELVFPSRLRDEDQFKDGLMVDTLLRQRRQGGVVRITIEDVEGDITDIAQLKLLTSLFDDMKKLSTVAKYLPEDDRPGLLILALIKTASLQVQINQHFGAAKLGITNAETAFVTFPSIIAFGLKSLCLDRNAHERLIEISLPLMKVLDDDLPVILARYIGNEMVPVIRVRMHDVRFEYHVSLLLAISGLEDITSSDKLLRELANSIATLGSKSTGQTEASNTSATKLEPIESDGSSSEIPQIELVIRNALLGLNPLEASSKGYIVVDDAQISSKAKSLQVRITLEVKKACLMVIDNNAESFKERTLEDVDTYANYLKSSGYAVVGTLLAPKVDLQVHIANKHTKQTMSAELCGGLLLLETCADSTQTLQTLMNQLSPPTPKSTPLKYRTEAVPVENMLASFTGNAFTTGGNTQGNDDEVPLKLDEGELIGDDESQDVESLSTSINPDSTVMNSQVLDDSMFEGELDAMASPSLMVDSDRGIDLQVSEHHEEVASHVSLDFHEDHFGKHQLVVDTDISSHSSLQSNPVTVYINNFHIIWNLFDGYDWQRTRDKISQAVNHVQNKATERNARIDEQRPLDRHSQEEDVIDDFLFNSIYIGVPASTDPLELARHINRDIDDLTSETGSHATSTNTESTAHQGQRRPPKGKKLRLGRGKYHKMAFDLKGISCDLVVHPQGADETQSSIDVKVQDLEIFDHLRTSTWKKFATYMQDAGERESETPMIWLQIENVRPVPDLAATEVLLKATILPVRLHVDQDALDFMTRFFEFRDEQASNPTPKVEAPFIQRAEVNAIRVKLDFKPKRVDYAGLRSGHTSEFMNFFVLDRAEMVLRHVILYGVSGFDRLGKTLNDIWAPDVKQNQLPGVLAGIGPIRSLVGMGEGVRDLVVVPIREYKKDGRVVRSFQKGALTFARTTTSELVKFGARLAIGTQTALQGVEDLLTQPDEQGRVDISGGWHDAELGVDEKEQISLYADQPVGVIQGLRGAYASLERDLLTAKDAIIAMPGEIMESGTAGGAARAVMRNAPTVILRPAVGMSKAVGQTLMGATNSLDPANRRRVEDKYKRH